MFYDVFKKLCDDRGINPTRASVEIGFSRGSVSYWKKRYLEGFDAKPDSYTAEKIADYFDVSVDYLLEERTIRLTTTKMGTHLQKSRSPMLRLRTVI